MDRKQILDAAAKMTNGNREEDYGKPERNFETIADMWNAYLDGKEDSFIEPRDVAAMLALLKIARIASGHAKSDNWIDLAGYAACGGELDTEETEDASDDMALMTEIGEAISEVIRQHFNDGGDNG